MGVIDSIATKVGLNTTTPRDSIATHLNRQCLVVVIKKVKAADLDSFKIEYDEFFKRKVLIPVHNLDTPYFSYFSFTTGNTGTQVKGDWMSEFANTDVFSISGVSTTEGVGSTTISLKNPNYKYDFVDNPLRRGQICFSPMDEVIVKLPGTDSNIYPQFSGYITSASPSLSGGGENNIITLYCEDKLKMLRISRTNVKPSLNPLEAISGIVAYANRFSDKRAVDALVEMLGRALIDFDNDSATVDYFNSLDNPNSLAASSSASALLKENYILSAIKQFLITFPLDAASTISIVGDTGQVTQPVTENASRVPDQIWGFSSREVYNPPLGTDQILFSDFMGINPNTSQLSSSASTGTLFSNFAAKNLAFVIYGTTQPAFTIALNKSFGNIYESEFRSNYELIQQVCQSIFFECFCDPTGVVILRPLNVALPADDTHKQGRVGDAYIIKYATSDNIVDTDEGTATVVYVRGTENIENIQTPFNVSAVYDSTLYKKYGWRVAPQLTLLNVRDPESLRRYGTAVLNRMNRYVHSGSITIVGDARIQAGNTIYYTKRNMLFYVKSISYNYAPGQSYTMTLNLAYGRKPLCFTDEAAARLSAKYAEKKDFLHMKYVQDHAFSTFIDSANNGLDDITSIYITNVGTGTKSQVDRIKQNVDNLTFGDYVWEDLSELNYDELTGVNSTIARVAPSYKDFEISQALQTPAFSDTIKTYVKKPTGSTYINAVKTFAKDTIDKITSVF